MLAELFGGVHLVKEIATKPRFDYIRKTKAVTDQFGIDEQEAIVADLPQTNILQGKIAKRVAKHYLAKFYLGLGFESSDGSSYDQAIKYDSDVLNGKYVKENHEKARFS